MNHKGITTSSAHWPIWTAVGAIALVALCMMLAFGLWLIHDYGSPGDWAWVTRVLDFCGG